jgi:hypothetical protein
MVYIVYTIGILLVIALEGYQRFLLDTILPTNLYGLKLALAYPTLDGTPGRLHKLCYLVRRIKHAYSRRFWQYTPPVPCPRHNKSYQVLLT